MALYICWHLTDGSFIQPLASSAPKPQPVSQPATSSAWPSVCGPGYSSPWFPVRGPANTSSCAAPTVCSPANAQLLVPHRWPGRTFWFPVPADAKSELSGFVSVFPDDTRSELLGPPPELSGSHSVTPPTPVPPELQQSPVPELQLSTVPVLLQSSEPELQQSPVPELQQSLVSSAFSCSCVEAIFSSCAAAASDHASTASCFPATTDLQFCCPVAGSAS